MTRATPSTPLDTPTLPETGPILVVGGEAIEREGLVGLLGLEGHPARAAASGEEALSLASELRPVAVLTDVRLPGLSGLDLLDELRTRGHSMPVVLLVDPGNLEVAVSAMRKGAQDVLAKPIDLDRLIGALSVVLRPRAAAGGMAPVVEAEGVELLGGSRAMRRLGELLRTAALSDAPVLIEGETGTGKELVARLVHRLGDRASRPFVALNCAALAEGVLESELFGHEKGSFTGAVRDRVGRFEAADGGTLFLDEVGEMGPSIQVKLLRVLEDGTFERVGGNRTLTVDVRLVSATNRDLASEVASGRFREDLFYRLNVIPVKVPPLRERPEDIPLLAGAFLRRFAERYRKRILGFTPEALDHLAAHAWPGNVRELQSAIERAVVFSRGERVDPSALPETVRKAAREGESAVRIRVGTSLAEAEKALVLATLEACKGHRARAARVLGISPRKIGYKLKEWGVAGRRRPRTEGP